MHAIIRQGNGKYYISSVFGYYSDVKSGKAGRTSGVFIQGVQGHKPIEETVYRLESIFKGKRRLI